MPVFVVIHARASARPVRRALAALLVGSAMVAHAQPGPSALPGMPGAPDPARPPEANFEQRIDPWSRLTLKFYADPVPGEGASGGMEARFLTRRLDAHQLQGGATVRFSPVEPGPVEAWQGLDDRRSALFVEDRFDWASGLSLTAGARLVDVPEGAAYHQRLALAWQPAAAWTLRATDGALQLPRLQSAAGTRRFRSVEVETEHTAGPVRLRARAASQQLSDVLQSQIVHAAALTLQMALHPQWSIGSQTVVSNRGDLTRLQLSGSLLRERARVSVAVPYRHEARPADTGLNAMLPMVEPDDGLGWRARVELRF